MSEANQETSPKSGFGAYNPDIIRGVRMNDFVEVQDALKQEPNCINKQDLFGRTASMYAAMGSNLSMLEWLSQQDGFLTMLEDDESNNLLHYAFWCGDRDLVNFVFQLLHPPQKISSV